MSKTATETATETKTVYRQEQYCWCGQLNCYQLEETEYLNANNRTEATEGLDESEACNWFADPKMMEDAYNFCIEIIECQEDSNGDEIDEEVIYTKFFNSDDEECEESEQGTGQYTHPLHPQYCARMAAKLHQEAPTWIKTYQIKLYSEYRTWTTPQIHASYKGIRHYIRKHRWSGNPRYLELIEVEDDREEVILFQYA